MGTGSIRVEQADTYGDDAINITDVTTLIDHLMGGSWPVVEPVYTMIGTANLFESEWDLYDERNNMVKHNDGSYHLIKSGYFQEGAEIYFRIVRNHNNDISWPTEDRVINISETGGWEIEFIYRPNAPEEEKLTLEINKLF